MELNKSIQILVNLAEAEGLEKFTAIDYIFSHKGLIIYAKDRDNKQDHKYIVKDAETNKYIFKSDDALEVYEKLMELASDLPDRY